MIIQSVRKIALLALALLFFGLFVFRADALSVSPSRIELVGDPGQSLEGEFLVSGDALTAQIFYVSSESFEAKGDDGVPNFFKSTDGIDSWISVPREVSLGKNEQKKIHFSLRIPKGTAPGGYFGAVFLNTAPPEAKGQVAVGAKIGVLVLLRVAGNVKEGGGLLGFSTVGNRTFYSMLPIGFEYRFQNSGADRVKPTGTILISNSVGLKKVVIPGNPTDGNVLPGGVRKFSTEWAPVEDTPHSFFGKVSYEFRHFAFGMYKAQLSLTYGTKGAAAADSLRIVIFPWHLLLVLLVGVCGGFFVLRTTIRKYNAWIISHAIGKGL
jgi:hypothetical protein